LTLPPENEPRGLTRSTQKGTLTCTMVQTVSVKDLRPSLPEVLSRIDRRLDRYVVTRWGKPVAVILGADDYESLVETLDILADKAAREGIRRGEEDVRKGRTRDWDEVKRRLAKV